MRDYIHGDLSYEKSSLYYKVKNSLFLQLGIIFSFIGCVFFAVSCGLIIQFRNNDLLTPTFVLSFLIAALVVLTIGIVFLVRHSKWVTQRGHLIENGKRIYATVVGKKKRFRIERSNGFSMYTTALALICQYTDDNGTVHTFESEPVWSDVLDKLQGNRVAIYVEHEDYNNYYVDFNSMK